MMNDEIRSILGDAVRREVFPGAVFGYIKKGRSSCIPVGTLSTVDSETVTKDTVYDVASVTKAIPTSSLALYLIDQQLLGIDDPVQKFLPHFIHSEVLIRHLLSQTLCFTLDNKPLQLSQLKNRSHDEILDAIYHADLSEPPGSVYSYCNATSIILGQVVESITRKTLPEMADEVFFNPLQMRSTTFHPSKAEMNIAPSEYDPERGGDVIGIVHDESAYALQKKLNVGSAGLFSTAPDLLLFLQMLLDEGWANGEQFFSKEILSQMTMNQLSNGSTGLGWELDQLQYMGKYTNPHMAGKTGFTGCVVMFDLAKKAALVLLSNYTYPKRKPTAEKMNQVRRAVADIIFNEN